MNYREFGAPTGYPLFFFHGWPGSAQQGALVQEIRVPVHVWHGREDANFHPALSRDLSNRIPGARFTLVDNEGHFSLPIRRVRDVLDALGDCATGIV